MYKRQDKKRARLEAMRVILSRIDYPDKDVNVVGVPDPLLVGRPELVYCLLYTSDAADERSSADLGGRRILKKKKWPLYTCDAAA